jgi:hypothetical protein
MTTVTLELLAVHFLLAVVLFFLANWLGKYSVTSGYHILTLFERVDEAPAFNFVFRLATPLVFLAIVSAALYAVGLDQWVRNIYAVVVFNFLLRWAYAAVMGRGRLLSWWRQVVTAGVTIFCAYVLYHKVLAHRRTLLPDATDFANELWVLVALYVYSIANNIPLTHAGAFRRRNEYIARRFRALQSVFSEEITARTKTPAEEALVYAVMIYETFNRPLIYRAIERWVLHPSGFARSLGPMQVQSSEPISDMESVALGIEKLLGVFRDALPRSHQEYASWREVDDTTRRRYAHASAIRAAAAAYNVRSDYASEIETIYDTLVEQFYPTAKIA